jgi:hypothetical protein
MNTIDFSYLKGISQGLYDAITNNNFLDPRVPKIEIMEAKNGSPNLRIINPEQKLTIHSSYNPEKEAEKIYNKMKFNPRKLSIAFGLGLGYHIDKFVEENPDSILLIVEPSYTIFQQAVKARSLEHILKNPNIKFLISASPQELSTWVCGFYHIDQLDGIQIMELPSYTRFYREEFEAIKKGFFEVFSKHISNIVTSMESGHEYADNCMRNVKHFNRLPWATELFGKFHNIPAIVISAGPSLHLQFERLRNLQEQAILIAVDTAFPILMKQGIKPHFVCTADPTSENFVHLRDVDLSDVYLIVEPMTYYKTLELSNVKAFIAAFDGYYTQFLSKFASSQEIVKSWGSIASTCFDLARKMNANPITFVGQDFAYSNLLTHCPTSKFDEIYYDSLELNPGLHLYTSYMTYHAQRIIEKPVKPVTDIYGNTIFTQHNLTIYANWFENEFKETRQKVINASERGILKNNCEIMSFSDVEHQYLTRTFPIKTTIDEIYKNRSDYNYKALIQSIESKSEELQQGIRVATTLKEKSKELLKFKQEANQLKNRPEIQTHFNELVYGTNCGLHDNELKIWLIHQNQKAETYFKRQFGKLVGRELDGTLVEETANIYYNFYDSKISAFKHIKELLNLALEGCPEHLKMSKE